MKKLIIYLLNKINYHHPNDIILINKYKTQEKEFQNNYNIINKAIEKYISEIPKIYKGVNTSQLLKKYNEVVPKEYQTKNYIVALLSHCEFLNAQTSQFLKSIKILKKDFKQY